jgi:hypothetical protein
MLLPHTPVLDEGDRRRRVTVGMWRFVRECAGGVIRWDQATLQAEHSKFLAGQQARGALHVALQKSVGYMEVLSGDSEVHHAC